MTRRCAFFLVLLGACSAACAEEVVIDFEQAEIGKPVPTWTEKGVVFKLAGPLTQSKATARIMFFPHLATRHKGILNAMATEQAIPVQAEFPGSVSSVTLVLWGSTGCPALLACGVLVLVVAIGASRHVRQALSLQPIEALR